MDTKDVKDAKKRKADQPDEEGSSKRQRTNEPEIFTTTGVEEYLKQLGVTIVKEHEILLPEGWTIEHRGKSGPKFLRDQDKKERARWDGPLKRRSFYLNGEKVYDNFPPSRRDQLEKTIKKMNMTNLEFITAFENCDFTEKERTRLQACLLNGFAEFCEPMSDTEFSDIVNQNSLK